MASATLIQDRIGLGEQRLVLHAISWESYVAIGDALPERGDVRMIYADGSLTFLTKSRRHEWLVGRLREFVRAVAHGCGLVWETAGRATFRQVEKNAGAEGDATFYFGENAEIMLGPKNIDLATQPPPDLAIEVEITHVADAAMKVWGRLGVPEVWRFDPDDWTFGFWLRQPDGSYVDAPRGIGLPMLEVADILGQMRLVEEISASRWFGQLPGWVRDTLLPRAEGR